MIPKEGRPRPALPGAAVLLALPAPLYLLARLLLGVGAPSAPELLGIGADLVPLLLWIADRPLPIGWLPAAAASFAGLLLALAQGFAPDGSGAALLGGLLLASPLLLAAALLRPGGRPPHAELPLVAAGAVGLLLLDAAAGSAGPGSGPGPFAAAVAAVVERQDGAWSTLLAGGNPTAIPLQVPTDGLLAGLLLLAFAGAFLGFVAPPPGEGAAEDAPPRQWLVPVGVGVGAAALFEVALARAPDQALLGLGGAVLLAVGAILLLARRPRPRTAARRKAVPPSPAAAAPAAATRR